MKKVKEPVNAHEISKQKYFCYSGFASNSIVAAPSVYNREIGHFSFSDPIQNRFSFFSTMIFIFFCKFEKNSEMYLESYISSLKDLCQKNKVRSLYVFGSVLTDKFNETAILICWLILTRMTRLIMPTITLI